jgi:hypothetical protein
MKSSTMASIAIDMLVLLEISKFASCLLLTFFFFLLAKMILPGQTRWKIQYDTSILLIKTLQIDCCFIQQLLRNDNIDAFHHDDSSGQNLPFADDPARLIPLKHETPHSNPTNKSPADQLLLLKLRCLQLLLRNANIGAHFGAFLNAVTSTPWKPS